MPNWAQSDSSSDSEQVVKPRVNSCALEHEVDFTTVGKVKRLGSLKSRVVRQRTLLGSSSRMYKFSQSLSSLTTITSADSTADSPVGAKLATNSR